jgi:hypothetical protein
VRKPVFSLSLEIEIAMHAAAPGGAQSKNPDGFFSSQSSLMQGLSPRGGSVIFHFPMQVSEQGKMLSLFRDET